MMHPAPNEPATGPVANEKPPPPEPVDRVAAPESPRAPRSRHNVFWLPTVIAVIYGLVVLVFALTGAVFGDEGGSWEEALQVAAVNLALVWIVVVVVSAIFRRLQER